MKKDRNYENITEEEWQEIINKTEKKLRKTAKTAAVIIAVIFIIAAVFWASIVYVRDYKVTEAAASKSPDGKYELLLQAVGEAGWPFGPADGRIVLLEGERRIAEADFTIHDDGGSVRESVWKVTWYGEYVEVILSGDEQQDEQILLYYDGEKERRQLSDYGNDTYSKRHNKFLFPALAGAIYGSFCKAENEISNVVNYKREQSLKQWRIQKRRQLPVGI